MATVVKVSTEALYSKVTSISENIKKIRTELANINKLQSDMAKQYWAGEAAENNFKELVEVSKDVGPQLYEMSLKTKNLFDIASIYDKVEGYNKHAEAGLLPEDFLE